MSSRYEYQLTFEFEMNDYDAEEDAEKMIEFMRRMLESFTDEPITVRLVQGDNI